MIIRAPGGGRYKQDAFEKMEREDGIQVEKRAARVAALQKSNQGTTQTAGAAKPEPFTGTVMQKAMAREAGGAWDEDKHPRDENGKFT